MEFAAAPVERAMTYQQLILRALAGTWAWLKATDVLGLHPRSLRRWRARYEQDPVLGLLDRQRRRPSHRTAPRAEAQRLLQLYRTRYQGFNVRHFHHLARRDHGVTLSYTLVELASISVSMNGWRSARRPPDPARRDRRRHQAAALCPALAGGDHPRRAHGPARRPRPVQGAHGPVQRLGCGAYGARHRASPCSAPPCLAKAYSSTCKR